MKYPVLDLFYYGDVGLYNTDSPSFVSNQGHCKAVLYAIAKGDPRSTDVKALSQQLNVSEADLQSDLDALARLKLIAKTGSTYALGFTSFLDPDLECLHKGFTATADTIVSLIESHMERFQELCSELQFKHLVDPKRWLYHLICDMVFDGTAFDYLENRGLFKTQKEQVGGRNYIVYGFENSERMQVISNRLLCSSNNFRAGHYTFNSFGDSDGARVDFFRLVRRTSSALGETLAKEGLLDSKMPLLEAHYKLLGLRCGALLEKLCQQGGIKFENLLEEEQDLVPFLRAIEYVVQEGDLLKCGVPVLTQLDRPVIEQFSTELLDLIYDEIKTSIQNFHVAYPNTTNARHGIPVDEVNIELWHQLFGLINEGLVVRNLVSQPVYREGEGRYFKSFYF